MRGDRKHRALVFYFSTMNLNFLEDFYWYIFALTGTLSRKFMGKWLRSGELYSTFSRALDRGSKAQMFSGAFRSSRPNFGR